ncbi:hypothetical protein GDO81_027917 [Engystomops pustulosus]|uniref:Uncharacterized protein n=1 Tax=Engystomops pustulosus TaxID=76066 RepID=A0AAV6Z0M5_ENGPU|nr:hypothetical protein GDO81_027932 [Engystomops pustulosus]KAG8541938.1 hypothetical protein GDO81_027917 [Engystomops pustulosus]
MSRSYKTPETSNTPTYSLCYKPYLHLSRKTRSYKLEKTPLTSASSPSAIKHKSVLMGIRNRTHLKEGYATLRLIRQLTLLSVKISQILPNHKI